MYYTYTEIKEILKKILKDKKNIYLNEDNFNEIFYIDDNNEKFVIIFNITFSNLILSSYFIFKYLNNIVPHENKTKFNTIHKNNKIIIKKINTLIKEIENAKIIKKLYEIVSKKSINICINYIKKDLKLKNIDESSLTYSFKQLFSFDGIYYNIYITYDNKKYIYEFDVFYPCMYNNTETFKIVLNSKRIILHKNITNRIRYGKLKILNNE